MLIPDTLGLFCAPSHSLAGRKRLAFGEAAGQAWICRAISSPFVREILEMLTDAGIETARTEIAAVGETMTLLRILSQGRHLAVLPCYPAVHLSQWFPLVQLALDVEPRERNLYLWCRASSLDSPSFVAVKETITGIAQAG